MAEDHGGADEVGARLGEAESEARRLRLENARLRLRLFLRPAPGQDSADASTRRTQDLSSGDRVVLFRSLFRGRDDVYALRWENPDGRSGYSPARKPTWQRQGDATDHLSLTDEVIRDHLAGRRVVGIYPLLQDETCWFLAVDFDKEGWKDDVGTFLEVCRRLEVPAEVERSRSGNGAHVWIFFEHPVGAGPARQLGSGLLSRALERRHQLGMDSYDRLFPNQDTLPDGGFGNLIALPLQGRASQSGNTIFLDDQLRPHSDQWAILGSFQRLSPEQVDSLVGELVRAGPIIPVRFSPADDDVEEPWRMPPSGRRPDPPLPDPLPIKVTITRANLVYVPKDGLPASMLARVVRLACFQNPDFYRTQAMRRSTFGKPRIIDCSADFTKHLGLPRGCLDEVLDLFKAHAVLTEIIDERAAGSEFDVAFQGRLSPEQEQVMRTLLAHEIGVLSAPTAFGKTVIAARMIAERRTNTVVLVHRKQLQEQWCDRLAAFLGVPVSRIGRVGAGRNRVTGSLDIALLQSLHRKGEVRDFVASYGQVIVDECHHIPAFTFEAVLREVKARYVLGLTATPIRKDGHHPIVAMQCGPIRVRIDPKAEAARRTFEHRVVARPTAFSLIDNEQAASIQDVYALLAGDEERNRLIREDVLDAIRHGRSPLLLTERRDHLDLLAEGLRPLVPNTFLLHGGLGARQRQQVIAQLASVPADQPRLLLATGRYIGEGFDDPRLDTLFLTLPISWKGTVQQYAGRLHRAHEAKRAVVVVDYVDPRVPVLARMFQRRQKGYEAIGYEVSKEAGWAQPGATGSVPNGSVASSI